MSDSTRKLLEPLGFFEFVEEKDVFCKSIDLTVKASFIEQKIPEEEDYQ